MMAELSADKIQELNISTYMQFAAMIHKGIWLNIDGNSKIRKYIRYSLWLFMSAPAATIKLNYQVTIDIRYKNYINHI